MNLLILSYAGHSNKLENAAKKKGHTVRILNPDKCYLYVSDKESGFDAIYYNDGTDTPEKILIKDIDFIIPRISKAEYGASLVEHLNLNLKIKSTQSALGILTAANKWKTQQKLSQSKIKVPKTFFASDPVHAEFLINKVANLKNNEPVIIKTVEGSQGTGVLILRNPDDANQVLASLHKNNIKVIIQQYIEADSKDIRVIVAGSLTDEPIVIAAMERTAPKDSLKANLSQGGTGKKIDLTEEEQKIAIQAAASVGLNLAGVDLIRDKNGTCYCIEVNSNFGLKIESITGINVSEKIIEFCEREFKAKRSVNQTFEEYQERNNQMKAVLNGLKK